MLFTRRSAVFLLLIAAAMVLRVIYAQGFIPTDDAEYARAAAKFLSGTFTWEDHFGPPVNPARLGLVVPLMALFSIFGYTEFAMALYPLALSLALCVTIIAFATRIFGTLGGIIAGAVWIFVPLDIQFAAKVDPDTAVTTYAALGLFAVYCARERVDLASGRLFMRGVLAGLAFGIGWLCKASMVYFAPFCLLVMLFDLRRDMLRAAWLWGGVAAGSIFVFGSEMTYYLVTVGEPLFRFETIQRNYDMFPQFFFNEGARWGYETGTPFWKAVAKRVLIEGPANFFLRQDYMYLPTVAVLASAYGLYKRDSRFYFVSLLFVTLLFMFNGFSASLTNYQPLPLFSRYSHALAFVGAILTGGLVATLIGPYLSRRALADRPEALFWGVTLAFIVFLAAGWATFRKVRDTNLTWADAERNVATMISPNDRVYTDMLSRAGLEFFWQYPPSMNVVNIAELDDGDVLACDSYVLLNGNYANWLTNNFGMWYTFEPFRLPSFAASPPNTWEERWSNGNATLYEVECRDGR